MRCVMSRRVAVILAVALLVTMVAGCGGSKEPQAAMFVFVTPQEPSTLDPAAVYDGSDRVTRQVYESLLQYKGSTGDVEPCLAESFTVSPDGKTYTFKLRKDVKFHDGTAFNAEAVKFSFDRMLKLGKGLAWAFKMVLDENSVTVIDEFTVQFELKQAYPAFPGMVASRYGAPIVGPGVMAHEKDGDMGHEWASEHGLGTGPYKVEAWTRNQEVAMVKNPDYWRGWNKDHIDRIVMKIVPDPSTQRMMLESGEAQAATHVSADDVAMLRDNKDMTVDIPAQSNFGFFIAMNTKRGPFVDRRVREALSYAWPYDDFVNKAFLGLARKAVGPLPAAVPGHDPNVRTYETDMDRAKQLLTEAGHPGGGFTVTVTHMQGQDAGIRIFNVLASTLAELGIKVQVQPLSWSAMLDQLTSPETAPDLCIGDWWDDYPDADSYLGGMCSSFFWTSANESEQFYSDPAVVDLLNAAAFEPDASKRLDMYKRIQAMLVEGVPAVWVHEQLQPMVMRSNVKGFVYNPYYLVTFNVYDMWIE